MAFLLLTYHLLVCLSTSTNKVNHGLTFTANADFTRHGCSDLDILQLQNGYCDSDWPECTEFKRLLLDMRSWSVLELYCMMGIKEEKYALLSTDVESVALYSACIGNGMVVKPPCGYQSRECTNVHRRRQPRGYVIKAKNLMDHNRTKPVDIKFHYKWAPRSQT